MIFFESAYYYINRKEFQGGNLIMAFNLRNRSFLTLSDFNKREMEYMLDLAEDLKKAKYAGTEGKNLERKNIA